MREHRSILDWGCGCGRVARHLAPGAAGFSGCDIDADNISWCAAHLPGRYSVSSMRPRLPYADGTFDLVYGFYALPCGHPGAVAGRACTNRVAGATLLMTVHGETTVNYARLDLAARQALLDRIEVEGIVCTGRNDQLDGYAAHDNEYVNVYHSQRYLSRTWGRYLEIVDILAGSHFERRSG